MKRGIILISSFLFISIGYSQIKKKQFTLELGSSLVIHNFEWSIAGNILGRSPNILSELKFDKIISHGHYFKVKFSPIRKIDILLNYQYNRILDGSGSDYDYKEDNRKQVSYKKEFLSNKGSYEKLNAGFATPLLNFNSLEVTTSVSYFFVKQNFELLGGEYEKELNSSYQKIIQGVQFSINNNFSLSEIVDFSLCFSYNYADYHAKANWNLIKVFQHPLSFSHASRGSIFELDFSFKTQINQVLSVLIGGEVRNIKINKGIDTSYLITGKEIKTQFNGAKGFVFGLKTGLLFTF